MDVKTETNTQVYTHPATITWKLQICQLRFQLEAGHKAENNVVTDDNHHHHM